MHASGRVAFVAIALAAFSLTPSAVAAPCQTGCPGKSALQCAADGLVAHQWCEFASSGSYPACANTPALCHDDLATCSTIGGPQPTEADSMAWDPVRKQLHFVGSPHNGSSKILKYDEATNAWTGTNALTPIPTNGCPNADSSTCNGGYNVPGSAICSTSEHGYEHNATDWTHGDWFVQRFNSPLISRWDGSTWTTLPPEPCDIQDSTVAKSIIYFTDMGTGEGLLANCRGDQIALSFWKRSTNTWSNLTPTGCSFAPNTATNYYTWGEYDRVNKLVWFGGRHRHSCTLLANGTFDQETDSPFNMGPVDALVAADPVGGGFVVRHECTTGEPNIWRFYDPVAEAWSVISWSMPPLFNDTITSNCGATDNMAATIPEYNVILYLTHGGGDVGNPKAFLYRHTLNAATTPPAAPTGVRPL
jgi:hypothetical protein